MKQSSPVGTFVVTAIFIKQRTIKAKSLDDAYRIAEDTVVAEGATAKNLSNWHAHAVDGEL